VAISAVAAVLLFVAALFVLHLPAVRGRVFDFAVRQLASRYNLDLQAARLDYNLFTRRVTLTDVRLAARGHEQDPFLTARRVTVALPWSVFRGVLAFNQIDLEGTSVSMLRYDNGSSNLPTGRGASDPNAPPRRLDIRGLAIVGLDFTYLDRVRKMQIVAADVHTDLAPGRVGGLPGVSGPIEIRKGIRLEFGEREVVVEPIAGSLGFDGSNVGLQDVRLRTAEGNLALGGRVERVLGRTALDLRIEGEADVARAAAWGTLPVTLSGSTKLAGTISGPAAAPTIHLTTDTDALAIGGVSGITAQSDVTVTTDAVVVDKARLRSGSGVVDAGATIPFRKGQPLKATAEWRDLDARAALRMAGLADRPIATALTGTLRYERTGEGPLTWRLSNRSRGLAAVGGSVPLDGELSLDVAEGRWQVRQQHAIPGTLTVKGDLNGQVDGAAFSTASLDAALDVTLQDVARASRAIESLGVDLPAVAPNIAGPAHASVTLAGRVDAIETTSIVDSNALRLPGLAPAVVRAEVRTNPSNVQVSNVSARLGSAVLSGQANIDLLSRQLSGAFELNASDAAELIAESTGGFAVHGPLRATATLAGTTTEPQVTTDVSGERLDVNGQKIDSLVAHARVRGDRIDVESFQARQREGELSGSGSYTWATRAYTADLQGANLSWGGKLLGPTESMVRVTTVRYSGAGTVERPGGEASAAFTITGGVAGTLVGEGTANARFTGDTALVSTHVPALGAFVDSKIATRAPYSYDALAIVNRLNLAALASLADVPEGTIVGNVSLSATASGTLSDAAATSRAFVNLQEIATTVNEVPISLATPSRLAWQRSTLTVDALDLQVGQGRFHASGDLTRSGSSRWDASFDGELGDLVRMSRAFGAPADLEATGTVAARWQSTGGLDVSTATVELTGGSVAWADVPSVTALTLHASFDGQTIEVPTLTGAWQGGGIQGSATIPRAIVDASAPGASNARGRAEFHVTKLGAEAFESWLGKETVSRLHGQLSASVNAEILGPRVGDIQATLLLDEAAYSLGGIEVQQARPTRVALANGVVTLEDVAWTAGESPLSLTGAVALEPAEARTLDVALNGTVNLRLLAAFAPTLATEGTATVDIRATGALSDPSLEGRVELKDAGLASRDPRLVIGQVNGPIVLGGRRITFEGVTGVANGGDLSLHGSLILEGASITGGQVIAQVQRMALEFPRDLQSEISALVTLTPQNDQWVLDGDVRIERAAYTEPLSLAGLAAARRSRPPVVTQAGPSFADRLRLNLFVVTQEDLRVDNNYGRIEAGAAVRVVGTAASPGLTGRVTIREGGQFYIAGHTFYIERGSITFTSPTRIEPEIDIEARAVVRSELALTLSGTLTNLKTEIRSLDPKVSDREAREALYGGLVGDQQALTLLSSELLGVTGRALGLDALRIERGFETEEFRADPTLIATETDPATRLTLSKRLRPEVELILSQSLSESGALSAIISYKPLRNVEVRATSRDNVDRSIAVRHEVIFGGSGTTSTVAPQPRITAIRMTGTAGMSAEEIQRGLRLTEGDRFDFHRWQRDIDEIRARYIEQGYYEVRVRAARNESAERSTIELEHRIERGPRTRLVIDGHPLHEGLVRELEDAWTRIIFDQFLVEEIESRVRRHLFAENYIGSTVEAKVTVSTPEEKEVRVAVSPGTKVSRHVLRYSGNNSFDSGRLDAIVQQAGLQVDGWLDPPRLTSAIEAFYREQGSLAVRATAGEPTVEGETAVLIVLIEEGPRYTVGAVNLSGVSESRRTMAERAIQGLVVGAAYDRAAVDRVVAELERVYLRQGFAGVRVETRVEVSASSGTVTITFEIAEGPQQILRAVASEGVTRTRDGVINRALRLRIGEPVDLEQWAQSRKRMYDTNVFSQVDIEAVPMEQTPEDQAANIQPVRGVVRVVEYPTWRLRYGGQYREERLDDVIDLGTRRKGFGILADLQNQNLFGRAVTGGIAGSYQPWRQATSVFASNGSFLGLPVRSSLFLFNVREDDEVSDLFATVADRRGMSFEQRWRPFRAAEVSYGYRYEWTHLYESNPNPLPGVPTIDDVTRTGRIRSALYIDRRNDPFNTDTGWFSSANFDQYAQVLGSSFSSSKLLLQQFYYRKLGFITLASAARVGTSSGLEQLQFEDRFVAGGGTTVRGYAEDALGPRDVFDRPSGGGSLLILNQEMRFPIRNRFGGVLFVDAGNVWLTQSELSLGDLELGYGFGLRFNTPFALLRVDYGIPRSSIPQGRSTGFLHGRWYFGIGQIF